MAKKFSSSRPSFLNNFRNRQTQASRFSVLADTIDEEAAEDTTKPDANETTEQINHAGLQPNVNNSPPTPTTTNTDEPNDGVTWNTVKDKDPPAPPRLHPVSIFRNGRAGQWRGSQGPNTYQQVPTNRNPTNRGSTVGRVQYGIHIDDLVPGALIWHHDVRETHKDEPGEEANDQLFQAPNGQWYYDKGRWWYVTSVHALHWNECPILTYRDKGIAGKTDAFKKEHIGLRPLHIDAKNYNKQNGYEPAVVRSMKNEWEKLSENSFIHFTESRSSNFNTRLRIVGQVDGRSIGRIAALRNQAGC